MKWIKVEDGKPLDGVDVHVVISSGVRGIAKFWSTTGHWLTSDKNLKPFDKIIKWKYENAK